MGHIDAIPVSNLPSTLLVGAGTQSGKRIASIVDRTKRRGLLDLEAVDRLIDRRPQAVGSARLWKATEIYRAPAFSRARSELLLLDLIKKAGLARPSLNRWVGEFEIDAFWEAERFAVEVDGWETHGTRRAFESDPVRIEDLKLAGIDAIRITALRIEREPGAVAARLRLHLARRRDELSR